MKKAHYVLIISSFLINSILVKAYTGEVESSFNTPGKHCTGMAYDGKSLWLADRETDLIYELNAENGRILSSIESPGYWTSGLCWDGQNLWASDVKGGIPLAENYNGRVYKLDPISGEILHSIPAPSSNPYDLCWDGHYLWCVDNRSDMIVQFSPEDGTTIKSFKAPDSDPRGLCFDGEYLWVSDRLTDEIYMIDPESGSVLIITESPGNFPTGMACTKNNLWVADCQEDKIFRLKIRDGEKVRKYNQKESTVTFTYLATNYGPGKVNSLDVHFAIPTDRDNQEIQGEILYTPSFTDIKKDKWGQETAHFHIKNIKAGETKKLEALTKLVSWDVRYYVYPDKVGSLKDIPLEVSELFLANDEKYQTNHWIIQKAVKEALGGEKNPYWIARKIYQYLMDKMYYEMSGGWNTAPTVLERGNGSCSEYSFVYISMCRAAGLPARYVGAMVIRGDDSSMDDVFHRWVEVYLPNYGWIPVDPSGGDSKSPRHQARYFGFTANRFLITTQSGGGSETMGWTYNSNESFTSEPKTNFNIEYFADWEPGF